MERKIIAEFHAWKSDPSHKALLVKGCRQVGKTYAILEFVRSNYDSFAYFNLEQDRDVSKIFDDPDITASTILERLSYYSDVELHDHRSVIVLDEIQASISAYSALKGLAEDGRYDIIASGSLLGVKINDLQRLSPLGYVNIVNMYPMDFEEFLWANGAKRSLTEYLRHCIQGMEPIDKAICAKVNNLFRRFMVIGGMPAAVKAYSDSRNYHKAYVIQRNILEIISEDAERYSKGDNRLKVSACLNSVPRQLARSNDKFTYFDVEKSKGGKRLYGSAILWLLRTGLIYECHNVSEPIAPLDSRVRLGSFKIFMEDTGVLTAMMDRGTASDIVNKDIYTNNGAVMENAICCALRRNGYEPKFYEKINSTLEVDFVINVGGRVWAIEVKSGKDKRAKSLSTLFKDHAVSRCIKISDGNIFTDENGIDSLPLFGACLLPEADSLDSVEPIDVDELQRQFDEFTEGS